MKEKNSKWFDFQIIYEKLMVKRKMFNKIKDIINSRREFVKQKGLLLGNIQWIISCGGYIIYGLQIVIARLVIRPKKNKIAFMSLNDYSDNARALSEYLINLKEADYDICWFVKDEKKYTEQYRELPIKFYKNEKNNNHYSWKAIFAAYSCEKICFTHGFIINKKYLNPKQKVINLWHGCGYKSAERKNTVPQFDFVLVPGNIFVKTKKEFFGIESERIWPVGYPRYDYLKKGSNRANEFIKKIKKDNKHFVIWMPTFRNTGLDIFPEEKNIRKFELPILSNIEELRALDNYCDKEKIILCIKRHPMQMVYQCEAYRLNNIKFIDDIDLKKEDIELYSILQYTDALISDYSSISVDYMLVNKPIAYALDDFAQYELTRGFVFDKPLDYMPGHHLYNFTDLRNFLDDISNGIDRYSDKRVDIINEFHNQSENYSQIVWETIVKNVG